MILNLASATFRLRAATASQLDRWYPAPGGTDRSAAAAGGAVLVTGADPEEYAHERALTPPDGTAPQLASPPAAGTVFRALGSLRRKLTGEAAKPPAPVPPPYSPPLPPRTPRSPQLPPPAPTPSASAEPDAADYEPEAEIEPGIFYSRKKPRFPRP